MTKDRRSFLRTLAACCVALAVVVAPAIAEEIFGAITKVDVQAKKVTVVEKDSDKDTLLTVNDDTEIVVGKGADKIDLEKLDKVVKKSIDAGKKGAFAKVAHEKGVASKINIFAGKKKAAP